MTVLERFKLELSNKDYYTDAEYSIFLQENNIDPNTTYVKATMQKNLLLSVMDTLETLANDVDLMRKIDSTDIGSTSEAIKWIRQRIEDIKQKILSIPTDNEEESVSNIRLLFTKNR